MALDNNYPGGATNPNKMASIDENSLDAISYNHDESNRSSKIDYTMSRTTLVKSMNMQSMRIQYDNDLQSELSDCEEQIDKEDSFVESDSRATFVVPDTSKMMNSRETVKMEDLKDYVKETEGEEDEEFFDCLATAAFVPRKKV